MQAPEVHEEAGCRPAHVGVAGSEGLDDGGQQPGLGRPETALRVGGSEALAGVVSVESAPQDVVDLWMPIGESDKGVGCGPADRSIGVCQGVSQGIEQQHRGRIFWNGPAGLRTHPAIGIAQPVEERVAQPALNRGGPSVLRSGSSRLRPGAPPGLPARG